MIQYCATQCNIVMNQDPHREESGYALKIFFFKEASPFLTGLSQPELFFSKSKYLIKLNYPKIGDIFLIISYFSSTSHAQYLT
jgi:hypothetical protein